MFLNAGHRQLSFTQSLRALDWQLLCSTSVRKAPKRGTMAMVNVGGVEVPSDTSSIDRPSMSGV